MDGDRFGQPDLSNPWRIWWGRRRGGRRRRFRATREKKKRLRLGRLGRHT
jgi:hypothetical protein